ncbi:chemotaxis protein CheB [Cohnella suwonensis]|uniref:Protein-glutamate methylesterase/protein-glutamine glutaminase n=1 Tax=Cohnella suwonensis TaxID=696072 RepID=A0ABW0M1Q4_9BACL
MPEFKVLIVDDSPFMRKVFSDVIDADAAFTVLATASNGQEAVELALKLQPDIITMDLEMPHMNGIEALKRIMEARATPVIMLSAVTDNGTRDTIKALQYGAVDFVRKPDGAVKLDIHQVREQLLEKLHIALETMSRKTYHLHPAVEEMPMKPAEPAAAPGETETTSRRESESERKPSKPSLPNRVIGKAKPALSSPSSGHSNAGSAVEGALAPSAESGRSAEPKIDSSSSADFAKPDARKPVEEIAPSKSNPPVVPLPGLTKAIPAIGIPKPKDSKETKPSKPAVSAPVTPPADKRAPRQLPEAPKPSTPSSAPTAIPKPTTAFTQVVAIGTSTGGPRALHEVLTGIPADFPAPILIVQHMPPKFTHSLAQRLDQFCGIHVREATDGEAVETATAYIAPGGRHMSLAKDAAGKYKIRLSDEGPRSGHMPSVDVLFESLIGQKQLKRHIVLMTGMGSDGAKGMKALRDDGAPTTIAESEQTCVVYGMPRSAIELGAASHVLPLQGIAPALVREVNTRKA